jgi:hypothetical protein
MPRSAPGRPSRTVSVSVWSGSSAGAGKHSDGMPRVLVGQYHGSSDRQHGMGVPLQQRRADSQSCREEGLNDSPGSTTTPPVSGRNMGLPEEENNGTG